MQRQPLLRIRVEGVVALHRIKSYRNRRRIRLHHIYLERRERGTFHISQGCLKSLKQRTETSRNQIKLSP